MALTRKQRESLYKLYRRHDGNVYERPEVKHWTYREFRKTACLDSIMGCLLVPWCGMVCGIEPDGYIHS